MLTFAIVRSNITKVQMKRCVATSLKVFWYGSIEWNMEENLSMEWKIFGMVRKIASMESEKIIFHSAACSGSDYEIFGSIRDSIKSQHY